MTPNNSWQVVAFLFQADGIIDVGVEDSPHPHSFYLEAAGTSFAELEGWLQHFRRPTKTPLNFAVCAPGAKLLGPIADRLLNGSSPQFNVMSAVEYLAIAKEWGTPISAYGTLVPVCRELYLKRKPC
ncbi:MAG: hypothetical protein JWQ72_2345 [Polaromonas sp.]|nr:hypothetical protein [Polaromonas sp.]